MAKNIEVVLRVRLAYSDEQDTKGAPEQTAADVAEELRQHVEGIESFWVGPNSATGYDVEFVSIESHGVKMLSHAAEQKKGARVGLVL